MSSFPRLCTAPALPPQRLLVQNPVGPVNHSPPASTNVVKINTVIHATPMLGLSIHPPDHILAASSNLSSHSNPSGLSKRLPDLRLSHSISHHSPTRP